MIRYIIIASILIFGASKALAQTPKDTRLNAFCNGKYSESAQAVDDATRLYGSVYSGGSHFRNYSVDLRHTIELYRTLQGLVPINYDIYSDRGFYISNYKPTASALTRALRLMTWPDPDVKLTDIANHVILLDVLTSHGPSDDWWLRIDDFKVSDPNARKVKYNATKEDLEYARTHVTPAQRIVADLTQRHDELDWLQSALILSSYEHAWRFADGTPPSQDLAALFDHIEKKALGGDYNRAWLSLLSHHKFFNRPVPEALGEIQRRIAADIENCTASPADYAALVAGNYPLPDHAVTPDHLDLTLEIEARNITFRSKREPVFDAQYHAEISALKDRAQDKGKFSLPLILSAPTIADLEAALQLNPSVSRPLLVLSGADLENISPGAAFTRHLSMKRTSDARRVLEKAIAQRPKLRIAIADILEDDLAEDIKMIMVALRFRCLSHLISDFCTLDELAKRSYQQRNITSSYVSDRTLQLDLLSWVFPEIAPWTPSSYYLQHSLGEARYNALHNRRRNLQRHYRRDADTLLETRSVFSQKTDLTDIHPILKAFAPETIVELKAGKGTPSGLMAMVDWEEVTAITGERRLARALSLDIIQWVRTAPTDPAMAEALHQIIRLNKSEDGGDIDGKPVGKVAFELLHQKFPDTDWAKKTPHWWARKQWR